MILLYVRRTLGEAWKQVKSTTLLESRIHEDFAKKVSLHSNGYKGFRNLIVVSFEKDYLLSFLKRRRLNNFTDLYVYSPDSYNIHQYSDKGIIINCLLKILSNHWYCWI